MKRKIAWIVLGAVLLVLIVALLWWWFLRQPPLPQETGQFGTSDQRQTGTATTPASGTGTRIPQSTRPGEVPAAGIATGTGVGTRTTFETSVDWLGIALPARATLLPPGSIRGVNAQAVLLAPGSVPGVTGNVVVLPPWAPLPAGATLLPPGSVPGVTGNVVVLPPGSLTFTSQEAPVGVGVGAVSPLPPIGGSEPTTPREGAPATETVPGVSWLGGTNVFSPTPINPIDSAAFGATPLFTPQPQTRGGLGLEGALVAAGLGTVACTMGLLGTAPVVAGATGAMAAPGIGVADYGVRAQNTISLTIQGSDMLRENFFNCLTRHIARVALNQITASIINWINSGFEGKPSFVQNYQQFFTNVADQAAGEFIRGSSLAFLCSPFQLQVRVAIAQSYARRTQAPACTLTRVTQNMENFMRGNFYQGGWPAFISFITVPTNNPYGAYMYGVSELNKFVDSRHTKNTLDLVIGRGFLSREECTGPMETTGPNAGKRGPPCRIITPGSVIEGALASTLGVSQQTLAQAGIAGNFDSIVSALIQQLVIRTLQGGLANLGGGAGYQDDFLTPEQQQAQRLAQEMLTLMQGAQTTIQQYAQAKQGAISDIQSVQGRLNDLANCWSGWGNSSAEQQALARITELEQRVTLFNNDIARANAAIARLQDFQTQIISVATPAHMQNIYQNFVAAQAAGAFFAQTDVTQAQQDRAALQSELNLLNQQTQTELNQCYAGGV